MAAALQFDTLEPTTQDNKWNLLAKILIATLDGAGGGGSGPTAPATFIGTMVGVVFDYAGAAAPTGFVLCYGQSLLRASYTALFAAIGTTYGAADGTHFNVPDLRGRVVAGKDNMGGASADRLTNASGAGVNGDTLGGAGGSESLSLGDLGTAGSDQSSLTTDNNVQPTFILNKIMFAGV